MCFALPGTFYPHEQRIFPCGGTFLPRNKSPASTVWSFWIFSLGIVLVTSENACLSVNNREKITFFNCGGGKTRQAPATAVFSSNLVRALHGARRILARKIILSHFQFREFFLESCPKPKYLLIPEKLAALHRRGAKSPPPLFHWKSRPEAHQWNSKSPLENRQRKIHAQRPRDFFSLVPPPFAPWSARGVFNGYLH